MIPLLAALSQPVFATTPNPVDPSLPLYLHAEVSCSEQDTSGATRANCSETRATASADVETGELKAFADTINEAVQANSLAGLSKAAGVGQRIAAYCGQNIDGTPK